MEINLDKHKICAKYNGHIVNAMEATIEPKGGIAYVPRSSSSKNVRQSRLGHLRMHH